MAAWDWIPPDWQAAGAPVPPAVDDALTGAPQGQSAPAAPPMDAGAPPVHAAVPFDDALTGAPSSLPLPPPAASAPTPSGSIPPPVDSALAGAPGAPQFDVGTPELPPPAVPPLAHANPPIAMPFVPPGAPRTAAELNPQGHEAWDAAENADIDRRVNQSPEDFAREQAMHAEATKNSAAADTLKKSAENIATAAQNFTTYQQASAAAQQQSDQVVADAQALAKKHVDADPRGTFSKILGVVGAFLGGLVAPYNGGRNVGLEAIQKEIERDVAAQQEELGNQWKAIGARKDATAGNLTRAGDMYRASETHRLSLWQAAVNDLQTKQAQYDPRGTTALAAASAIRGARAQMAEIQNRLYETNLKNNVEIIKTQREQQEQALKLEQFKQQKIKDAADIEVAKQNANTSSYSAQTGRISALNTAENAKDELKFKVDQLKASGDTKGAEQLQKFGIVGVTPDDPSQKGAVLAGNATDTEMGPLRDDVAATRSIVNDIDQIMAIRHGGSTKTGNSAEYQQLKALGGDLLFKLKEANKLKNITDTDLDILTDVKGFDDPTKFRSFKDGILQFRQNTIDNANEKLHAHGVPGKIDLPPLPPSQLSETEQAVDFAAKNPAPIPFSAVVGAGGVKAGIGQAQVNAVRAIEDKYTAATPGERPKIRAALVELSNNAPNDDVKAEAAQAVGRIDLASSTSPEPAPAGSSRSAN